MKTTYKVSDRNLLAPNGKLAPYWLVRPLHPEAGG